MESNTPLDWGLATLALFILLSGLWMLFSGVQNLGNKP